MLDHAVSTRVAIQRWRVQWTQLDGAASLLPRGLTVLETERGVLAVVFARQDAKLLMRWPRLSRLNVELHARSHPSPAARALLRYAEGSLRTLDHDLDFSLATPFERQVFEELRRVGFGELTTYSELARRVGKPRATRAVGGAMQRNPLPLFVPCHRVVASDGSLGGFNGGLALKRRLLDLEGVARLPGGWRPSRGQKRKPS